MKLKPVSYITVSLFLGSFIYGGGGCSTTEVTTAPAPAAIAPAYVQVPHPSGMDVSDLRTIFLDPKAPALETLKTCDAEFRKLNSLSSSLDEKKEGIIELVRQDPVGYHWCFYGKQILLEEVLRNSPYADERQKAVVDTYDFAVPVARSFMTEFHDSRYLRWAIEHYKHVSQWVFYRPLQLTPQETSELVDVPTTFGLWRDPTSTKSVLEKYNLGIEPSPSSPQAANPVAQATPSAVDPAPPVANREPASVKAVDAPPPAADSAVPPPPPPNP